MPVVVPGDSDRGGQGEGSPCGLLQWRAEMGMWPGLFMRAGRALTLPVAAEDRSVSLELQLLSPLSSPSRAPFQMPPLKGCCREGGGVGSVSCGPWEPWAV